jgi:hypothetical protein
MSLTAGEKRMNDNIEQKMEFIIQQQARFSVDIARPLGFHPSSV